MSTLAQRDLLVRLRSPRHLFFDSQIRQQHYLFSLNIDSSSDIRYARELPHIFRIDKDIVIMSPGSYIAQLTSRVLKVIASLVTEQFIQLLIQRIEKNKTKKKKKNNYNPYIDLALLPRKPVLLGLLGLFSLTAIYILFSMSLAFIKVASPTYQIGSFSIPQYQLYKGIVFAFGFTSKQLLFFSVPFLTTLLIGLLAVLRFYFSFPLKKQMWCIDFKLNGHDLPLSLKFLLSFICAMRASFRPALSLL